MHHAAPSRSTPELKLPPGWRVIQGEGKNDVLKAAVRAALLKQPVTLSVCKRQVYRPGRIAPTPLPSYEGFLEQNRDWLRG
jgi:hypothetical protein